MDRKTRSDLTKQSLKPKNTAPDASSTSAASGGAAAGPAAPKIPNYMKATNSTASRHMTPVLKKPLIRPGSVTRTPTGSTSNLSESKKTSTPLKPGARGLDFSNASSIKEVPILASKFPGPGPGAGLVGGRRVARRQSMVPTTQRGPLRAARVPDETVNEEIEAEIRRAELICSLRLKEKALTAKATIENKGLQVIGTYHQLISAYRKDISDLMEKKKRMETLLPYARQVKVLRDGLQQVLRLKGDIESSVRFLVTTTREKLSLMSFESGGLSMKEAEDVMKQAEQALNSPELEKIPLLIEAFRNYMSLQEKLIGIETNVDKAKQLIRDIEKVHSESEMYRKFREMEWEPSAQQTTTC